MKRMIDTKILNQFAKKTEISSMSLLGSTTLSASESVLVCRFENVDLSKITQKTLLIFTYANCFVLGMLSQTGEGRVLGNLVNNALGNSEIGKVKFQVVETNTLSIQTDVIDRFGDDPKPTAYLFAFSVL